MSIILNLLIRQKKFFFNFFVFPYLKHLEIVIVACRHGFIYTIKAFTIINLL